MGSQDCSAQDRAAGELGGRERSLFVSPNGLWEKKGSLLVMGAFELECDHNRGSVDGGGLR